MRLFFHICLFGGEFCQRGLGTPRDLIRLSSNVVSYDSSRVRFCFFSGGVLSCAVLLFVVCCLVQILPFKYPAVICVAEFVRRGDEGVPTVLFSTDKAPG